MSPDPRPAQQHVRLLTGSADTPINVRMIYGQGGHAYSLSGPVADLWPEIEAGQAKGYNAYLVVNEGGDDDASITRVRAVFIDADGLPMPDVWHAEPDFIVSRDANHWHAYWIVSDLAVDGFKTAQRRLAAHYGTDVKISNPARLMRLAGSLHLKDPSYPFKTGLTDNTGGKGRSRLSAKVLAGLPEVATPAQPVASAFDGELDQPHNIVRAVTYLTTIPPAVEDAGGDDQTYVAACGVRERGISKDKCLELMLQHYNPRCIPEWDDWEISAKVDNAYLYAQNGAGCEALEAPTSETFKQAAEAAGALVEATYPPSLSAAELAAGVFPRPVWLIPSLILEGHVNLLVGDGKVGKTFAILHMAVAVAAGLTLWGQECRQAPVLMVLSEDDYGETKARLANICAALGVALEALPIEFWCLPSENLILARVADNGAVTDGPFLQPLLAKISETGARCVFLDPLSDFADLDETKRLAANAYCKKVLGPLSHKLGVTVVQTAHPSKASMEDHSVVSGSTAWKNAVRNVLSMERPKEDQPSPRRILRGAWVNYGEETSFELSLVGGVLCKAGDYPEGSDPHSAAKEAVFETVASLLGKGKQIVRTHGNGLKPNDVAAEVAKRTGLKLHKTLVLTLLNELDREDRLAYQTGGNKTRGQQAGFYLPTRGAE